MQTVMPFALFGFIIAVLLCGYPVAFSLAGGSLIFAGIAYLFGLFDPVFLNAVPERLYGIMRNETLIAVPLFVFMGVMLERGKIAEDLLVAMGRLFGRMRGGLAISVCAVGGVLAASTGIVGATVVTMGLISLPVMLRHGYSRPLASGVITASGTLGQIIPPSIVLVLLGDVVSNANQKAQLALGNFAPETVSVGDLFFGALIPGLILVGSYIVYVGVLAFLRPSVAPPVPDSEGSSLKDILRTLLPPLILIVCVLGSILGGIATPTEASGMGAAGAVLILVFAGKMRVKLLREVMHATTRVTCMVFVILIGANIFSLVFRGLHGDAVVGEFLASLPGGVWGAFILIMLLMFVLGFFLDFLEIIFVVVPIVAPILLQLGLDPVWLGVMIALNLQTSFLTPPFGFALFYLRGVAPPKVTTGDIYRGAIPFVIIQLAILGLVAALPATATWLPKIVFGG